MSHGFRADRIVGYTFNAENFCVGHIVGQLTANPGDPHHGETFIRDAETHLDLLARIAGIDRMDEGTFDSGEFPKVIFSSQLEVDEYCGVFMPDAHTLLDEA